MEADDTDAIAGFHPAVEHVAVAVLAARPRNRGRDATVDAAQPWISGFRSANDATGAETIERAGAAPIMAVSLYQRS